MFFFSHVFVPLIKWWIHCSVYILDRIYVWQCLIPAPDRRTNKEVHIFLIELCVKEMSNRELNKKLHFVKKTWPFFEHMNLFCVKRTKTDSLFQHDGIFAHCFVQANSKCNWINVLKRSKWRERVFCGYYFQMKENEKHIHEKCWEHPRSFNIDLTTETSIASIGKYFFEHLLRLQLISNRLYVCDYY